ncbi:serine protein kinase, putative [Cordyceps militaris]|uniref:Serine protein kinase, putative n=1 Tax=Cordyceps militaris TaxID=73501 RepID=A0A2H4SUF7_CORMI|nr:serine protein kinase, putative [Cordyceps militaris]
MSSTHRPLNPDTIEYPEGDNHQLKLSILQSSESHVSVKVPYRAYVEYYNLDKVLESAHITSKEESLFGLYAYQLTVPNGSSTSAVGISLPGAPGTISQTGSDADKRKEASGKQGGTVELYLDELPKATAEKLHLKAIGGQGATTKQGAGALGANGDGGDGGSVKIVYDCVSLYGTGSDITDTVKAAINILDKLHRGAATWPEDFQTKEIPKILNLLRTKAVMARLQKDRGKLDSKEAIARCSKEKIEALLSTIVITLTKITWSTEADELLRHIDNKTWPQDFGDEIDDFLHILTYAISKGKNPDLIPSNVKTHQNVAELKQGDFMTYIQILIDILANDAGKDHSATVSRAKGTLLNVKKRTFPYDFSEDFRVFFKILDSPELIPWRDDIASGIKSPDDLAKRSMLTYRRCLSNLVEILDGRPTEIATSVQRGVDVSGGNPGLSLGTPAPDGQVHHGNVGTVDLDWIKALDKTKTDICFAHPVQCQMLLDRASFLFCLGSAESVASSLVILQRLQRRLQPFAEPFAPDKSRPSEPLLWRAYRDNAGSLFTVEKKTPGDASTYEEPHAIQQFRAIRTEAATLEQQIYSGHNFYGKGRNEVPRCTFAFYSDYMDQVLSQLKNLEETLTNYLNYDEQAAKALVNTLEKRHKVCETITISKGLEDEAKRNVVDLGHNIKSAAVTIASAKATLMSKLKDAEEAIKKAFSIGGEELVNGLGEVVFATSMGPYTGAATLGLQMIRLWSQGVSKIKSDETGLLINKSYLIQQLEDVQGGEDGKTGLKNINEGYKVISKTGNLSLSDPGGKKLLMLESDFRKALGAFRSVLGEKYKDALSAFDSLQTIVEKRNRDVVEYNCAVVMLFKYIQKQEQLNATLKQVNDKEYDVLSALHPAMRAFLQKRYKDVVETTLFWLYNMQQAHRYQALEEQYNRIGEVLATSPTTFPNHAMLFDVKNRLVGDNKTLVASVGQPSQTINRVAYQVKDEILGDIQRVYTHGMRMNFKVTRRDISHGMYDMRINAVRFYAEGAKTKNAGDKLYVRLTHPGPETFVKRDNSSVTFTHQPLTVLFICSTKLKEPDGRPQTISQGKIGLEGSQDNPWARVGPLTTWGVEITQELNEGLDLSEVKKAYFEFDISYRTQA